jgi:hypothetical protein
MKKTILSFMILGLSIQLFAFDFNKDEFFVKTDIEEGIAVTKNEVIYVQGGLEVPKIIQRIKRPIKIYNDFGILELNINNKMFYVVDLNGLLLIPLKFEIRPDEMNSYGINENITVQASSSLIEDSNSKKIEYKPSYLLKRLTQEKEIGEYLYWSALPWAVDIKKDKSPSLIVVAKEYINSFSILNGYVDFSKQKLYKENSRAKKINIIENQTGKVIGSFDIDDNIQYQKIALPKKLKEFTIKVVEIYQGEKYSDLCISSIIFDDYFNQLKDYGKSELEYYRKKIGF